MGKAILISIRPNWCKLIAEEKKTIEIRKTRPKIDTPFKCYIYETKGFERVGNDNLNCIVGGNGRGAVIGEFACDRIFPIGVLRNGPYSEERGEDYDEEYSSYGYNDCLTDEEFDSYLKGENGYGWHISKMKMYFQPKSLSEFRKPIEDIIEWNGEIARPPQSWRYVEELP